MASRYWIKAWIEILDDPKMGHLPHRVWRRAVELFLVAGEMHRGGRIPNTEALAWRLRCDVDELAEDLAMLESIQIIIPNADGWKVRRFADRQSPVTAAERQRHSRRRQKQSAYYGHDARHEAVTIRDTDQIQIREEQNRSEASPTEPVTNRDSNPEPAQDPQSETDELWERISDALRLQMTQAMHDQWISPAKLVSVDEGQIVIGFPQAAAAEAVRKRLGRLVLATVGRELGRDVAVEYEVTA